ncbi:diacylglycerol/lipid kinase family protein [Oryzihumus sp.]|uniref:diacylglycerol/lipid kinase family protein n=1 Tax=Oryzihumus sp. TaxID=1968903 RepID=UPI002ED848B0
MSLPTPRPTRHPWQRVDPPLHPVLFVNPQSGNGAAGRAGVADRARSRGINVVTLTPGQSLTTLVDVAVTSGADALGMAGGDGSLAAVAAAAASHALPFICVPAGTRNHFAADLGVDRRDVAGALDAFIEGVERRIDVGEVNDRMFLNNVSLAIYGEAVRQSAYRDAKVRTLLETAQRVLGPSRRVPALHLVDDEGREHVRLALVLVSNNPYALERPPARGTRPSLDGGQLGVVIIDTPDNGPHPPGRAWSTADLDVSAPGPVPAGIDGEAVDLQPPLHFAIRPMALRVRIPARRARTGHRP